MGWHEPCVRALVGARVALVFGQGGFARSGVSARASTWVILRLCYFSNEMVVPRHISLSLREERKLVDHLLGAGSHVPDFPGLWHKK